MKLFKEKVNQFTLKEVFKTLSYNFVYDKKKIKALIAEEKIGFPEGNSLNERLYSFEEISYIIKHFKLGEMKNAKTAKTSECL